MWRPFFADQTGLAHATDSRTPFATKDELNSTLKLPVQAVCQLADSLGLGNKGLFGNGQVIHDSTCVRKAINKGGDSYGFWGVAYAKASPPRIAWPYPSLRRVRNAP